MKIYKSASHSNEILLLRKPLLDTNIYHFIQIKRIKDHNEVLLIRKNINILILIDKYRNPSTAKVLAKNNKKYNSINVQFQYVNSLT